MYYDGRNINSASIIRVADKTAGFSIILNECFQRDDISARAKGLFAYIMTLPNSWVIRKAEVFTHFTEGRDALDAAFKELITAGYIRMEIIKEKGRIKEYKYIVYETAEGRKSLPDIPVSENPVQANPQLLNTDLSNNSKKEITKEKEGRVESHDSPPSKISKKPTIEEVKSYCVERGNDVSPQKWLDHYKSNGWKVGKNPMKDWRAAIRTWEPAGFIARKPKVDLRCPICGGRLSEGICVNPKCEQYL